MNRPRFGYERIHVVLRREGWKVNRKRVHRLYRLEGLQVRMRVRRRKRLSLHRGPAPRPTAAGERWSMPEEASHLVDDARAIIGVPGHVDIHAREAQRSHAFQLFSQWFLRELSVEEICCSASRAA